VAPPLPVTYSLTVLTDYGCQIAYDEMIVSWLPKIPVADPGLVECTPLPAPYSVNLNNLASNMLGALDPVQYVFSFYDANDLVSRLWKPQQSYS
jgi:hypothetical protein